MTPQARQYLERKLSYVPETGNVLEDYRRRRDRLNREMDSIGVPNEDEDTRYEVTMSLLGPEPIQEGGFLSERVPAAAGRGADKFGMNVGAMAEYFGRSLGSEGLEGFGQDMAARNRQLLERSPAPYASPEEQERQGYLGRVDDLILQAGEETIGSAPAIVPPLIGAATGGVPGAVGGFAGVLAANAALEGGSTYSDRKQYYMRQGMPEDQAAKQAKKEADEVAIANLTDPELVALAGVQGASGAIAKGLLPNAGRAARYGTIGGLQAGSGALQEGRQYEVSETATGNPMEQFTGRFSTPEGRNSMLVGAISEAVPTAAEAALAADPRVDPVATDLRRRTQDAAYNAVSANDALEAQRQEALAAAQQQAALEEAERIQKSQAEEQARQRKEQVQREKDALQLMKLEAQAIRERLKTTNEMARAKNEATPAASSGTSTTATSERTAPTAEQIFSSQQEQKRRAAEQTSQIPVPSSPTTTTAPSTADLLAIQQEQQRVAQERAQQATEQQQQQQPEADPEPTIDLAAYEAIQEQERLKEEEAQRVMEMRQQWEDNLRKRQEVLLLPAPAETSASTTEEGPAFQSPRTQELYEQFKTRRRNEATQELRNIDQSQEAQQETFQTPEGQALYDQFKAEKRQQMEQLGMVETPAPMEQEADLRAEDPMETTQEDVTTTPEEDTLSTELGGQMGGQDLVQDQTEPVVEETAPLPERLPAETLEPTPADELKSDLLRKKEAATQAYEEMDDSLFGTKEEDKLDAAMEKADRAYERGLTKAQKEWDKLSANTGKKGTLAPNQLQNAERRTKKLFEDAGLRRSQADPLVYTQKLIEFGKDEMANTTPGEADVVQGRKREEMEDDFGMDDSSGGGMYSGYGDSNQYYDDTDTDLTSELRYSYSATSRPTNAAGPSTKLTARQVNAAMEGVKSVLKKLDPNGDRVTVVANKAEAVAKLQEMGRDRDAAGLANREDSLEEGFTLTDTGNIVLIADQIQGKNLREAVDRMVEVTFHEALGHAGLRGLMGEKFDGFIKNFGIKNGKKVDAWLKTKDAQPYVNKDRNTQIEEYIAKNFAETGARDVGFLENLVQNVLSSLGLRQYSETALKKIMQQVQQEFVDGNGNIIEGAQRGTRDVEGEEETATPERRTRRVRRKLGKPPAGIDAADYKNVVQQILDNNADLDPTSQEVETALKAVLRKIPPKLRSSFLSDQEVFNVSPDQAQGRRVDYGEATSSSNRETIRRQVLEEIQKRKDNSFVEETLIRSSSRPDDLKQQRIQLIEKLRQREITNEQYDQWIDENDPIMTLGEKYGIEGGVPTPATDAEIEAHTGGIKNAGKAIGKVLDKDVTIPDGTLVGNRLDIPAYTDFDSWVVTLHDGTSKGGNALAYGAAARIKGHPSLNGKVEFATAPKQAFQIAGGRSKSTIARMRGGYVNQDRNSLTQEAQDIIENKTPGWVEVGMNPNRASYFYDKANRRPLLAADEVIQVGALVLAKNPTYGTKDDFSFVDKETGNTIRFSSRPTSNLIGGQVPLSNWTTPTESKIDDFLYTMQDKMIDTKRVVESIKEAVGNIDERWNPYLQEELYHGRTAKETKDFLTNELQPLMEDLQRFGVSIKDFDNYLWNRHAEERNIQMAKVNPDMPDGGSGLTTAEARDYLANLSPQKRRVFEQLAQRVDNITSQTRQILKDSSLESAETVDTWESVYEKYVPLEREEFDFQPMQPGAGIGQGYDVRNPASRRAVGSERGVIDVLANVALQRERAITRSNKNKVAQAVYGLAAQNPNTDFWLVIDPAGQKDVRQLAQTLQNMGLPTDIAENFAKEPVTSSTDTRTGLKVSRINASIRDSNNYLSTRINGQDKFVIFNAKNPSSQRMVRSLKNLDADQLGRVMGILGNVTRWMTSVNTQYNPIFGVVNLIRDVQGALINLTSTPIGNKQRQVFAGTPLALKGIYAVLRKDTNRQNQYSQLWEEFQQEGGQTGYKDMFARSDERATALEKELKGLSAGKPMKTLNAIRDWLSDYNEAMENAVRLSAYKVAKEEGMSKQAAASLAKNLTVNFNRKGQIATQAGALYSFFNAAVQGTGRMYETMKGPAGAKILKGGLLLGTAQALLLEAADFDEDEPPYFVREKNVILPLVGGGYLTIPMPLGLHIIPNTSRILTEFVLSGGRDTAKRVGQFTGSFLDAFNPIGNAGWSVQTIAPTVADPLVALSENRDWTGSPIAKEDMVSTRPTPGYTRAKDTASTLNTYMAYFLNAASGGTDYQKGLFSPTPDQLDYLVGQAFGGVGRELLKAEQTVTSAFTGEELPPYKIPLAGRFYGNTESSAATSNRFYTNITRLNEHEAEVKGRRANRENVAEYLREFPEARLAGFAGQVETAVRKLQKRKREMLKKNASRSSIEAIEKLITRRMQTLNDRVERFAQTAD